MLEFDVKLNSQSDAIAFVNTATKLAADIDVLHGKYIVDGKSILGVLSLDLSNELTVRVNGEDLEEVLIKEAFKAFLA